MSALKKRNIIWCNRTLFVTNFNNYRFSPTFLLFFNVWVLPKDLFYCPQLILYIIHNNAFVLDSIVRWKIRMLKEKENRKFYEIKNFPFFFWFRSKFFDTWLFYLLDLILWSLTRSLSCDFVGFEPHFSCRYH